MQSLPKPTLPNIDMNSLNTNYQQPYRQQPNYAGSVYNHGNPPQQHHPNYYQQSLNPGQFSRRNSLSSVNSDQVGLTSHPQGQPWSSPYYNHSNNGSSTTLSYNTQHQQYHTNNNYAPPQQQQLQNHQPYQSPPPSSQRQPYTNKPNYY